MEIPINDPRGRNHFLMSVWTPDPVNDPWSLCNSTKVSDVPFIKTGLPIWKQEFDSLFEFKEVSNPCVTTTQEQKEINSQDVIKDSVIEKTKRSCTLTESKFSAKSLYRELKKPTIDPHFLIHPFKFGEVGGVVENATQPFRVIVHPQVPLLCDLHSNLSESEVIGLLAGKWLPDRKALYIQLALPCSSVCDCQNDGSTDVELDPEAEWMAREAIVNLDLEIIGWYHSHPRFQPDPSVIDIFNQQQFQHFLKDQAHDGLEPFVGLIISTYDKSNTTGLSLHQWFSTSPYVHEGKDTVYMPVELKVEYSSLITPITNSATETTNFSELADEGKTDIASVSVNNSIVKDDPDIETNPFNKYPELSTINESIENPIETPIETISLLESDDSNNPIFILNDPDLQEKSNMEIDDIKYDGDESDSEIENIIFLSPEERDSKQDSNYIYDSLRDENIFNEVHQSTSTSSISDATTSNLEVKDKLLLIEDNINDVQYNNYKVENSVQSNYISEYFDSSLQTLKQEEDKKNTEVIIDQIEVIFKKNTEDISQRKSSRAPKPSKVYSDSEFIDKGSYSKRRQRAQEAKLNLETEKVLKQENPNPTIITINDVIETSIIDVKEEPAKKRIKKVKKEPIINDKSVKTKTLEKKSKKLKGRKSFVKPIDSLICLPALSSTPKVIDQQIFISVYHSINASYLKSSKIAQSILTSTRHEFKYIAMVSICLGFYYSRFRRRVELKSPWRGLEKIKKLEGSAKIWLLYFKDSIQDNLSQSQEMVNLLTNIISFYTVCWEEFSKYGNIKKVKPNAQTNNKTIAL